MERSRKAAAPRPINTQKPLQITPLETPGRMIKNPPPQHVIDTSQYNKDVYGRMYKQTPNGPVPVSKPTPIDYSSIEKLDESAHTMLLKRTDLDLNQLKGMDRVNATMYRWKLVADNVLRGKRDKDGNVVAYSAAERDNIANNFYKMNVAPAFQSNGSEAMSPQSWMHQAYSMGPDFDIDEARGMGNFWMSGWHGTLGLIRDGLHIGETVMNSTMAAVNTWMWPQYKSKTGEYVKGKIGQVLAPPVPITDENWAQATKMAKSGDVKVEGFFDAVRKDAGNSSMLETVRNSMHKWDEKAEVLEAMRPARGFIGNVTSMGISAIPFIAAEALSGGGATPMVAGSLSEMIGSSQLARLTAAGLRQGAEGGAYGLLTEPYDNKERAVNDAINWAVLGAVIHLGGQAIKGVAVGTYNAIGERIKAGRTTASPQAIQEAAEATRAEFIAGHGIAEARALDNGAAAHILKMEASGMTPDEIRQHEVNMLQNGTVEDRHLLDAVMTIRSGLAGEKLSELSHDAKADLLARLETLNMNAANKMTKHVATLQEAIKQRFMALKPEELDKNVMQYLMKQVLPTMKPNATPEEVVKAVQEKWAGMVVDAQRYADEEMMRDPFKEATQANARKEKAEKATRKPGGTIAPVRKAPWKAAVSAVKYKGNALWTAYAKNAASKLGKAWNEVGVTEWLNGMKESEFAHDLYTYFMPKYLRDAKLSFESGTVADHQKDYTNLYAFMWNFKDQMPTEVATKLQELFSKTKTMQGFFEETGTSKLGTEARKLAELELMRKQAISIWNTTDDFLGSGLFPKETRIFRSAGTDLANTTEHQDKLFSERVSREIAIADKLYKADTPANKQAKNLLKVLFNNRWRAYKAGDVEAVRHISDDISEQFMKTTKGVEKTKTLGERPPESPEAAKARGVDTGTKLEQVVRRRAANPMFQPPPFYYARHLLKTYGVLRDAALKTKKVTEASRQAFMKSADVEGDAMRAYSESLNKKGIANSEEAYKAYQATSEKRKAAYNKYLADRMEHHEAERKRADYAARADYMAAVRAKQVGAIPPRNLGTTQVDSEGRVTMWLDHEIVQLISEAEANHYGETFSGTDRIFFGRNMDVAETQTQLQAIMHSQLFPDSFKARLHEIYHDAMAQAGPTGVSFSSTQPVPGHNLMDIFREEWGHGWQRYLASLKGTDVAHHISDRGYRDLLNSMPQGMRRYLQENYANKPVRVRLVEASIKTLTQPPRYFNMTEEEALDYAIVYMDIIEREHGPDAFTHMTTAVGVGKDLIDAFYRKPKTP